MKGAVKKAILVLYVLLADGCSIRVALMLAAIFHKCMI